MPEARCPGVAEANLSHLVLFLKRLDIADMGQCKFLDRPGLTTYAHVVDVVIIGKIYIFCISSDIILNKSVIYGSRAQKCEDSIS